MAAAQLPLFGPIPAPAPAATPPPTPTPALALPEDGVGSLEPASALNAAIVAYLEHLRREGMSEHTINAFGYDLRLLAKHAGPGTAVGSFTVRGLTDYLHWLQYERGAPCSLKTLSRRITSLKSFFRWLAAISAIDDDPAAPVLALSVRSPLPEILYPEEIERALAAARQLWNGPDKPDLRPYVIFTLILHTGIKKGECLALTPNHVDLSHPEAPVLHVRYANPRQRFKERKLPLDPGWIPAYRAYLAQYLPATRLFPWSPRRMEYLLEDITVAAGLEKHISFDMLRWTCAVRDRLAGMDPNQVRQKLGLSQIQWNEIGRKLEQLVAAAAR